MMLDNSLSDMCTSAIIYKRQLEYEKLCPTTMVSLGHMSLDHHPQIIAKLGGYRLNHFTRPIT